MADTTHDAHHEPTVSGSLHVSDPKILWTVWVVLLILLGLTYAASTQDFGKLDLVVALVIAIIKKTVLVVLYFMGVKYNTKLTCAMGRPWVHLDAPAVRHNGRLHHTRMDPPARRLVIPFVSAQPAPEVSGRAVVFIYKNSSTRAGDVLLIPQLAADRQALLMQFAACLVIALVGG